jgi:hypothetical protein
MPYCSLQVHTVHYEKTVNIFVRAKWSVPVALMKCKTEMYRPDVIRLFNWANPFSRPMALGSTQPLTEMSTRNLPGSKGRPARKADNLTAMYEPIV